MEIEKWEIEQLIKHEIAEDLFQKAVRYAREKQMYIFRQSQRAVVLQRWYLIQLVKEYAISLSFSHYTMELCTLRNE